MKSVWLLALGLICVTQWGCVSADPVRINSFGKKDKVKTLTYDSNLRSIFVANRNAKIKFCSEPSPDSADSINEGLGAQVPTPKGSEAVSISEKTNSTALGGRSGTVLLAREILFRVCEMGVNYDASYEQQVGLFIRALESIEKLADEQQTSSPITRALSSEKVWKDAPNLQSGGSGQSSDDSSDDDDDDD